MEGSSERTQRRKALRDASPRQRSVQNKNKHKKARARAKAAREELAGVTARFDVLQEGYDELFAVATATEADVAQGYE